MTVENLGKVPGMLDKARAGSREALGELLMACRQYLLLVANRELDTDLQGKVNPSDVVQETFLEAQRDFEQFKGETEAELLGWLRRILLNNLANLGRGFRATAKRDLEREVSLESSDAARLLADGLASSSQSPSLHAMANEQASAMAQAIARLPERYQEVIRLRHQEARSFEEIAQLLNCSADAARKLWSRAIDQLQQQLDVS